MMSDLREAAVAFLAIVVALVLVVLALFAVGACTLHVDVTVRPQPVAVVPSDAAVAVTPPASPGLLGDAGPCNVAATSLSLNGCSSSTYYVDATPQPMPDWMQL